MWPDGATMRRGTREEGYALVTAVASIAVVAGIALATITATQSTLVSGTAETKQIRAVTAAEAGIALVLHRLTARDPAARWPFDGRTRIVAFGGFSLAVRVEDERGKVPLNLIDERALTALLAAEGLEGDVLATACDSLLDWIDADDEVRPFGAERDDYVAQGYHPRNGPLASLDELAKVRGFDPALVLRVQQVSTVHSGGGAFDPRFAQPIAIGVMGQGGAGSAEVIDRAREIAGQRVALLDTRQDSSIAGHPLTIVIDARAPDGAHAARRALIEVTGLPTRPYVIRDYR